MLLGRLVVKSCLPDAEIIHGAAPGLPAVPRHADEELLGGKTRGTRLIQSFRGRSGDAAEPREAVVADFTGDGKNDLAVLVLDRILVYPQE